MKKSLTKRALSLVLCVVMIASCWVFTAPSASAATAGNYHITINVNVDDTSSDAKFLAEAYIKIGYKENNGTGTQTKTYEYSLKSGDGWSKVMHVKGDHAIKLEIPGFPESFEYKLKGQINWGFDGCDITCKSIYLTDKKNNKETELSSGVDKVWTNTGFTGGGSKSCTWPDVERPKATSITAVSGTGTVAIPKTSTSTTTNAYKAGTVKDQYGVNWYQDVTSLELESTTTIDGVANTSLRGVTFDSSTKKLTITNAANAKEDYKIYLKQTYGSITQRTYIELTTFDYNVTFMNGSTKLGTWSFDYGETPAYGSEQEPTKLDTANPPKNAYTFDGWAATSTGNVIELPALSGVQAKTYYAHFSESKINYTVKFVNNENTEISSAEYHIDDTLTPPESAQIPDTYESVDKVYTFTGWVGTNGEVYDGTCHGAITYKPVYSDVPRQYTVTFKKEDGTVIKSQKLNYNTIPSSVEGLVPALIDKEPDDTYHYTPAWNTSVDTAIKGDTEFKIVYTGTAHELGEATTKTEATCASTGIDVQTCSVCNHEVETETPINPNNHNFALNEPAVADGANTDETPIYYHCDRCDKYFRAGLQKNAQNNYEYVPLTGEGAEFSTSADAELDPSRATVPSPTFNSNSSDAQFYDVPYSNRPSQMRLTDKNKADGTKTNQSVRFIGSIKIPEDVSYEVGEHTDDVVLDFGFVWTQTMYICDGYNEEGLNPNPEKLKYIPEKKEASGELGFKIQKMSVVDKNANNGAISNWTGCTHWTRNEGRDHYYTFNLVVAIKPGNWGIEYCARPYITYKYHGQTYTVYDQGKSNSSKTYNHESVVSLATKIMEKNYLYLGSNKLPSFSIKAAMQADGINISDIKDYNNALNRVARDKKYVETKGIFSDEELNSKTTTNLGTSSRPNYEWISSALTESTTYRFTDKTFK